MFLGVIILARRISSEGRFVFWFGGSSNLFSLHEHFSVLATRSETCMKETPTFGMGKVLKGNLLKRKLEGERVEERGRQVEAERRLASVRGEKEKKYYTSTERKETSFGIFIF